MLTLDRKIGNGERAFYLWFDLVASLCVREPGRGFAAAHGGEACLTVVAFESFSSRLSLDAGDK